MKNYVLPVFFLSFQVFLALNSNPVYGYEKTVFLNSLTSIESFSPEKLRSWGVTSAVINSRLITEELVDSFDDCGIKVFAEITLFQGETVWKKDPSSRPIRADGRFLQKIGWYAGVCPNLSWLQEEKLRQLDYITGKGVKGVMLDFIRYPCHWEVPDPELIQTCFCERCMDAFRTYLGEPYASEILRSQDRAYLILTRYSKEWSDFKCQKILDFIIKCREITYKKGCILGIFSVPWRLEDKKGAIRHIIGQDYREISRYVDIISPMVYHRLCGYPVEWVEDMVLYTKEHTDAAVWPIIESSSIPIQELPLVLDMVKDADGMIFFGLDDTTDDGRNKVFIDFSGIKN